MSSAFGPRGQAPRPPSSAVFGERDPSPQNPIRAAAARATGPPQGQFAAPVDEMPRLQMEFVQRAMSPTAKEKIDSWNAMPHTARPASSIGLAGGDDTWQKAPSSAVRSPPGGSVRPTPFEDLQYPGPQHRRSSPPKVYKSSQWEPKNEPSKKVKPSSSLFEHAVREQAGSSALPEAPVDRAQKQKRTPSMRPADRDLQKFIDNFESVSVRDWTEQPYTGEKILDYDEEPSEAMLAVARDDSRVLVSRKPTAKTLRANKPPSAAGARAWRDGLRRQKSPGKGRRVRKFRGKNDLTLLEDGSSVVERAFVSRGGQRSPHQSSAAGADSQRGPVTQARSTLSVPSSSRLSAHSSFCVGEGERELAALQRKLHKRPTTPEGLPAPSSIGSSSLYPRSLGSEAFLAWNDPMESLTAQSESELYDRRSNLDTYVKDSAGRYFAKGKAMSKAQQRPASASNASSTARSRTGTAGSSLHHRPATERGRNKLPTDFRRYFDRGDLPVSIMHANASSNRIEWKIDPLKLNYHRYLPLFIEGLRERNHPYVLLAEQGLHDMIRVAQTLSPQYGASERIVPVIPQIILPLKQCLLTWEPPVLRRTLRALTALGASGPAVAKALALYYKHFMPTLNIMLNTFSESSHFAEEGNSLILLINETVERLVSLGGETAGKTIAKYIPTMSAHALQAGASQAAAERERALRAAVARKHDGPTTRTARVRRKKVRAKNSSGRGPPQPGASEDYSDLFLGIIGAMPLAGAETGIRPVRRRALGSAGRSSGVVTLVPTE